MSAAPAPHAIILVGGRGTRLQPLTDTRPKPVLPIVGEPFLAYQLAHLRRHGIHRVTFACGFMPQAIVARFGDGAELGMQLDYVIEPKPLGTGGAIAFAANTVESQRLLVLNGDVLGTLDFSELLSRHVETGAKGTIALTPVEDPSRYGLVRVDDRGRVAAFLEKPDPDEIDTDLINAGTYVLEPSVVGSIPSGEPVSVERDVFPKLVGRGLYAHPDTGYWNDIGTIASYLRANRDVLDGRIPSPNGISHTGVSIAGTARVSDDARIEAPAWVGPEAVIDAGAVIGHHSVIGPGARVGAGARVAASVLLERSCMEEESQAQNAIIGEDATVAARCTVSDGHVVAPGTISSDPVVRGVLAE